MRAGIGKWIGAALTALLFILLLQGLIEGPPGDAAAAMPPLSSITGAALMPYSLPAPEGAAAAPQVQPTERLGFWALLANVLIFPALTGLRDANGRVLRTKRYVLSAYQVFRQEAACG